jgi:hypothetical protein
LGIFDIGICETSATILSTIDSELISNEKIATNLSCCIDTFETIFKAKDVFHIAGLAARIINSPGLNPASISSNHLYHENTFFSFIFSGLSIIETYSSTLEFKISEIDSIHSHV